jgi:hypothetical protein
VAEPLRALMTELDRDVHVDWARRRSRGRVGTVGAGAARTRTVALDDAAWCGRS